MRHIYTEKTQYCAHKHYQYNKKKHTKQFKKVISAYCGSVGGVAFIFLSLKFPFLRLRNFAPVDGAPRSSRKVAPMASETCKWSEPRRNPD